MKTIKINFVDPTLENPKGHYFVSLLSSKYNVEISDKPDYLFYDVFGNSHHEYDCIRIFFTGENVVPNFNYCDYALGFYHIDFEDRYMRLPLWRLYFSGLEQYLDKSGIDESAAKREFCAAVISNSKQTDGFREAFFEKLNAYKQIASGGKYNNNVGGRVADKIAFQKDYKFSLAFENVAASGYCTEKILESFASHTIPIYYGDRTVVQDFNPKAFINCNDYKSMDEVIERIKELDNDDAAYMEMLKQPIFVGGKLPDRYSDENVLKFLSNIVEQPIDKARRRKIVKPYMDFDYRHMKQRDVKLVLKAFLKNKISKLIKK